MGQILSSLYSALFPNKEYKLVMVGLDNAGKTTTLYQLHLGQAVVSNPTVGSNVEQVKHRNLTFEVWDLGGQANLRPSWATYYQHTDCIIMVVDSTDRGRVAIAKSELGSLLKHEHLAAVPVLVFANKQDLLDAMSVAELTEALGLRAIGVDWHVQAACAVTGDGLTEGLEWVAQRCKPSAS